MALLTTDQFREMPLGLKKSTLDAINGSSGYVLQNYIDVATQQVKDYCDRQLESADVTDVFDGTNGIRMMLREYPVTEIKTITWEDELGQEGVVPADWVTFRSFGELRMKNPIHGVFFAGRVYTVTYTAGYTALPVNIRHATALWTLELLSPTFQAAAKEAGDLLKVSSEQIGELLEKYRRKGARGAWSWNNGSAYGPTGWGHPLGR